MAFLFVVFVYQTPSTIQAGEPEDFRGRAGKDTSVGNSRINTVLNNMLYATLAEYNSRAILEPNCSRRALIDKLVDKFDRNYPALLAKVSKRVHPVGSQDAWESKQSELAKVCWAPTYRVKTEHSKHMMGLDKIDHFFAHGYLAWLMLSQSKSATPTDIVTILKKGIEQEESAWGLKGPGIKSYADLSANYLGLKFWQNLTDGPDPLLVCKEGRYAMTRQFDLFTMIDASVDETVNCNSYADKDLYLQNEGGYKALGIKCPMDPNECARIAAERGPEIAALTLHPLCRGISHNQIERPSPLTPRDVLDGISGLLSGGENLVEFWFTESPDSPEKAGILQKTRQNETTQ